MTLPKDIIAIIEKEADGLQFGTVALEVHVRDSAPRYVIRSEKSILSTTEGKNK